MNVVTIYGKSMAMTKTNKFPDNPITFNFPLEYNKAKIIPIIGPVINTLRHTIPGTRSILNKVSA